MQARASLELDVSSGIVSIQWMEPLFLPRGWHRSPNGRWLLVSEARRPLALVARLQGPPAWSWRSDLPIHRGHWWSSPLPEPFDLTLERVCKALREGGGQKSEIRYAAGLGEALELQIFHLWTTETTHAAPSYV